jgi:hypothetical protein
LPWLPLTKSSLFSYYSGWRIPCIDKFLESITPQLENGEGYYAYPLAWAYSDLIVVPKKYYRSFCNYCGIFGATSVFVETGAPTALLLSCPNVMTESKLPWRGMELRETSDREGIVKNYNGDVKRLLEGFAQN